MFKYFLMLQVKAYGPGLQPTGVTVNKPTEFTIDARMAGKGQLKIYAQVKRVGASFLQFIFVRKNLREIVFFLFLSVRLFVRTVKLKFQKVFKSSK